MEVNEVLALVVVVALFIGVSVLLHRKRVNSSWEGVLIKKRKENDEGGVTYRLIVKTKDDKKKRISVKRSLYEQFNEGDKIVKTPGEYNPKKA